MHFIAVTSYCLGLSGELFSNSSFLLSLVFAWNMSQWSFSGEKRQDFSCFLSAFWLFKLLWTQAKRHRVPLNVCKHLNHTANVWLMLLPMKERFTSWEAPSLLSLQTHLSLRSGETLTLQDRGSSPITHNWDTNLWSRGHNGEQVD